MPFTILGDSHRFSYLIKKLIKNAFLRYERVASRILLSKQGTRE